MVKLGQLVPIGAFTLDVSRLGYARLTNDDASRHLIKGPQLQVLLASR